MPLLSNAGFGKSLPWVVIQCWRIAAAQQREGCAKTKCADEFHCANAKSDNCFAFRRGRGSFGRSAGATRDRLVK